MYDPNETVETTQLTGPTPDDIRRKAEEYAERGNHECARILRSVADEMDAERGRAEDRPPVGPRDGGPSRDRLSWLADNGEGSSGSR